MGPGVEFDEKAIKNSHIQLSIMKINKMPMKSQTQIVVTYNAKGAEIGPSVTTIPIRVNKGPRYKLIIMANVTTPEIKLTTDVISFGRVICGQRMKTFIRF